MFAFHSSIAQDKKPYKNRNGNDTKEQCEKQITSIGRSGKSRYNKSNDQNSNSNQSDNCRYLFRFFLHYGISSLFCYVYYREKCNEKQENVTFDFPVFLVYTTVIWQTGIISRNERMYNHGKGKDFIRPVESNGL